MNDQQVQAAYEHYHRHYDNAAFKALQEALLRDVVPQLRKLDDLDLRPESELYFYFSQAPLYPLMNFIIDAALQASGHPDPFYTASHHKLITQLRALPHLRPQTVQAVNDYLKRFNSDHRDHQALTQLEQDLS
jgi:hypothetical protein